MGGWVGGWERRVGVLLGQRLAFLSFPIVWARFMQSGRVRTCLEVLRVMCVRKKAHVLP